MEAKQKKTIVMALVVVGLLVVCSAVCCCGSIFMGVKTSMESSGAYTQSLDAVQQDDRIKQALGEPIVRDGMMITGNINASPDSGSAQMNYTIKGSTGKTAEVSVHASRSFDVWTFQSISVQLEPGQPLIAVTPLNAPTPGLP